MSRILQDARREEVKAAVMEIMDDGRWRTRDDIATKLTTENVANLSGAMRALTRLNELQGEIVGGINIWALPKRRIAR
jgi:hypothetical protein